MRLIINLFIILIFLNSCTSDDQIVNVYSSRHYASDEELFRLFSEKTGIKVNLVKADTDQLLKRLELESANTHADLFITADASRLVTAKEKGLLQPIQSKITREIVPLHLADEDWHWVGMTKRARIIVYDKSRVNPGELSTYEDLIKEKWRGRILVRSSQSHYNQALLASIIAANGKEHAQKWAEGIVKNMAQEPRGNDRDQVKAIVAGIGDIAIINSYYLGLLLHSSNPEEREVASRVGIFFPNQHNRGTHVNISGIGLTAASKNIANAQKLVEFILSKEMQSMLVEKNHEYPVNQSAPWTVLLEQWGQFHEDTVPLSVLGKHQVDAMLMFDQAGWR